VDNVHDVDRLWVESFEGEILGETLFGLLAARETDEQRRAHLELLTRLESATKELARPVIERRGLAVDVDRTVATATAMAEATTSLEWHDFLASLEPATKSFLDKYRTLVELVSDDEERRIAEAYVAHERALAAFARRALGREAGDPEEPIRSLPHVSAATSAS
jgi:hypothetical protein